MEDNEGVSHVKGKIKEEKKVGRMGKINCNIQILSKTSGKKAKGNDTIICTLAALLLA